MTWGAYPLARPVGGEQRIRSAQIVLRRLLECSELTRIEETDAWRPIFHISAESLWHGVGAERLLDQISGRAGGRRVRAGLVHGDLALHNILK
jgi:hypothetical protein